MERMEREQNGHKKTPPLRAGCLKQEGEEQEGRENVKHKTAYVVPRRVETVQFTIHHVGDPGQRVPVARMGGRENLRESPQSDPGSHHRVLKDILVIVKSDEFMLADLEVDCQGSPAQDQPQDEIGTRNMSRGFKHWLVLPFPWAETVIHFRGEMLSTNRFSGFLQGEAELHLL